LKYSRSRVCSLLPARHVAYMQIIHMKCFRERFLSLFLFEFLGKQLFISVYNCTSSQFLLQIFWGYSCSLNYICYVNFAVSCGHVKERLRPRNYITDLGHISKKRYWESCILLKLIPLNHKYLSLHMPFFFFNVKFLTLAWTSRSAHLREFSFL